MWANPGLVKAFVVVGSIPKNTFAKLGASDGLVTAATAATDTANGVVQAIDAADGEHCDLIMGGIAKVTAGGAIALGAQVTPGADGKAVAAASGNKVAGIAVEAATADGQVIPVLLTPGGFTA